MSHQSASPQLSEQQQRFSNIISDAHLSPKQKSSYLALEAEASLPYMPVSKEVEQALQQGVLCDMFEGQCTI